jgi:indole-3-glycerol phosphate synthase
MPANPRPVSLDAIVAVTRTRVEALLRQARDLELAASKAPPPRPFPSQPQARVGVIAEVKRRSPSQGAIREDLDPVAHAAAYARAGAVAVSVLTDEAHFGGSLEDLRRVAREVAVPVLRKDFIINEVQIHEARAAGASAVLLIARILTANQLDALARVVRYWDMTPVIEVHAESELDAALGAVGERDLLGVNARDLDTFAVDMRAAEQVIGRVPAKIPVVAESGVETRATVERLAAAGADFVLVGTSVARSGDPERAVRALVGVRRQSGVRR